MRRLATLLVLSVTTLAGAACAGAKAQVQIPDQVPLAMPAAPPHVVVPAPPEAPPAPVVETPTPQVNPPAASGGPPRTRTEPPPARPAPPPATPPATPTPVTSAPTPLEAAPNQGELEQRARGLLASAERTMEKIDYKALGPDGRAQYDTAKRFIKQADEALKAKNIVYAWQLADKANTIATLLK